MWFRGAAPSLSHCVQHYFLLTVLLETSLKRNANALISIPATLLRFFSIFFFFPLLSVFLNLQPCGSLASGNGDRESLRGIGVPVEGRLRSQQLSGWKYNSCLKLTSFTHTIVFGFFKTKLILALAAWQKKNNKNKKLLNFLCLIFFYMKRQMPVFLFRILSNMLQRHRVVLREKEKYVCISRKGKLSPLFTAFCYNWCRVGPSTCLEGDKIKTKQDCLSGQRKYLAVARKTRES